MKKSPKIAFEPSKKKHRLTTPHSLDDTALLHKAAFLRDTDTVKALLEAPGIQVNATNDIQQTALHLAAAQGWCDGIHILLNTPEIQVNATDKDGQTALHWAAKNGFIDVVRALLKDPEIQVDAINTHGKTAEDLAAAEGHRALATTLQKYDPAALLQGFKQSHLIRKIKLYVRHHNRDMSNPQQRIQLPAFAENGWCSGFVSTWGYLKVHGDDKHNEKWFFKHLYDIANTPYEEIKQAQQSSIEKIIGYINMLQVMGPSRMAVAGFNEQQWNISQSLGLRATHRVTIPLNDDRAVKLLLKEYVISHPGQFARLSFSAPNGRHAVGLVYDDNAHLFTVYDPNQSCGDVKMDILQGEQIREIKTPERLMNIDTLVKSIPNMHPYEKIDITVTVYQNLEQKSTDELDVLHREREAKKLKFLNKIKHLPEIRHLSQKIGKSSKVFASSRCKTKPHLKKDHPVSENTMYAQEKKPRPCL